MADTSPSAAQQMIGDITPKLADLTDDVLFGDVWKRPELSPRDRSLVTISALTAAGRTEQLEAHLRIGIGNGLSVGEIGEAITHLAFYSGWPSAFSAAARLKAIAAETARSE
jgi:4-carboxymuconolactone decarboxylase